MNGSIIFRIQKYIYDFSQTIGQKSQFLDIILENKIYTYFCSKVLEINR